MMIVKFASLFSSTFLFILIQISINIPWAEAQWFSASHFDTNVYTFFPDNSKGELKPLLINLHGCGQSNFQLKTSIGWQEIAEKYNVVITLPQVPGGGVYGGCWDFFGDNQGVSNFHFEYLESWINKLVSDKKNKIDPNQVFISGFSSGGGMSLLFTCLRPNLIAGVGIMSAPSLGVNYNELLKVNTTPEQVADNCRRLAGDNIHLLSTIVASFVVGKRDFIVNPKYTSVNAGSFLDLAEERLTHERRALQELSGVKSKGFNVIWSDPIGHKISYIRHNKLGHNIPSGTGRKARGGINGKSINYPLYMVDFLIKNNRRH